MITGDIEGVNHSIYFEEVGESRENGTKKGMKNRSEGMTEGRPIRRSSLDQTFSEDGR
jgi:hypothetical protein